MLICIKELKQCIYTKKYYSNTPKSYPFIFNTKYSYNNTNINKAYMFPHTYCLKVATKTKVFNCDLALQEKRCCQDKNFRGKSGFWNRDSIRFPALDGY